jgi:DNA repair protein RadD
MGHDIFSPEIGDKRPTKNTIPVKVPCPVCDHQNDFWGYADDDGNVYEHFGRKCRGATQDPITLQITPCGFRFRLKVCHSCGAENDITAKACEKCDAVLIDADAKLKQAKLSKNFHVLTPDKITFDERKDKNSNSYLEIRYYDHDAQYVSEAHFFNNSSSIKKFNINFLRSHLRRPELAIDLDTPEEVIKFQKLFRLPSFVIARKQDKFWKITEKIFAEEL